jgi:hypothetical protein
VVVLAGKKGIIRHMNKKRYVLCVLISLLLIARAYAAEKKASGMLVDKTSVSLVTLPDSGDIPKVLDQLGYQDNSPTYALRQDLNGDGAKDFLIVSAEGLCGTGGCPYAIIDGKTRRRIGDFFGSPIVISERRINSYPVIQAYSHASAWSGNFTTYVYDGREYQEVSNVFLVGESIEVLFKSFNDYRKVERIKEKKDK